MNEIKRIADPLSSLLYFAKVCPEDPAILMNGISKSFSGLYRTVRCRAAFFAAKGVNLGDRVAIYTDSDYELSISMFALWGLGAVYMPMPVSQRPEKLRQIEKVSPPTMGFYGDDFKGCDGAPFPMYGLSDGEGLLEALRTPEPEECAIIMFTSGTSGVPKAVPMTYQAIWHNVWQTSARLSIVSEDRIFINTPLYYTNSIIHMLTMLCRGASIVADRAFVFGSNLLESIERNGCTGFGGVPVHFSRLLSALKGRETPEKLRFLMNSGEHLPVPVLQEVRKSLPTVDLFCVYGLTEVAGRLCILDPELVDDKPGSVGRPLAGMDISVRDEDGSILLPGEEGEVFVNGVCLMKGYLNNPEINRKLLTDHGFATGDLGHLDDDGCLFLTGRKDDVIKVGAEKVSMKVIEEAVFGFEAFSDFVVAPYDDERMGTVIALYYVLNEGAVFRRKEVVRHLKRSLDSSHLPVYYIELNEVPRSRSGKKIRKGLPST